MFHKTQSWDTTGKSLVYFERKDMILGIFAIALLKFLRSFDNSLKSSNVWSDGSHGTHLEIPFFNPFPIIFAFLSHSAVSGLVVLYKLNGPHSVYKNTRQEWGQQDKNATFSRFLSPKTPTRNSKIKETLLIVEFTPFSLGVMLGFLVMKLDPLTMECPDLRGHCHHLLIPWSKVLIPELDCDTRKDL